MVRAAPLSDPDATAPAPSDPLDVALGSVEASATRLLHDIASARHAAALREAFWLKDRLGDLRAAVGDPGRGSRPMGGRP